MKKLKDFKKESYGLEAKEIPPKPKTYQDFKPVFKIKSELQEEVAGLKKVVDDLVKFMNTKGGKDYTYQVKSGPKYYKILQQYKGPSGQSVHAFIDKNTGLMYKPASYNAPAKGPRFDLKDKQHQAILRKRFDNYGSYLYKR